MHEHRVLKAESTLSEWEEMLIQQEKRLEQQEEEMTQRIQTREAEFTHHMQQMGETLEDRQSERILEDGSDWEDHIHTKVEEYVSELLDRLQAIGATQLTSFKDGIQDVATQRELKTKA